jgi:hypothetical protein
MSTQYKIAEQLREAWFRLFTMLFAWFPYLCMAAFNGMASELEFINDLSSSDDDKENT